MRRSLSCQSALVTRNGMRESVPYAVLPSNSTSVVGVASWLLPMWIQPGSIV